MIVVTFYSYKGGVGRSMAMANVAELLAQSGSKVVMCDWDFEAPGLERFAVDEQKRAQELLGRPGIIDLLVEYKKMLSAPGAPAKEDSHQELDFVRVESLMLRRPTSYAISLRSYGSGWLKLLTAGRRDGTNEERYAGLVQDFDWNDFYENWAGASYLEFFRNELEKSGADIVLIDSRTGVTEHGGVCTHHLADVVILMCSASDQNLFGTKWMADGLGRPELKERRGGRGLELIVVPSRIDQRAEVEALGEFRARFRGMFGAFSADASVGDTLLEQTEIPYLAHYSFRERVIARASKNEQIGAEGMLAGYRSLANAIAKRATGAEAISAVPETTAAPGGMSEKTSDRPTSGPDIGSDPLDGLQKSLAALVDRLGSQVDEHELEFVRLGLANARGHVLSTRRWLNALVLALALAVITIGTLSVKLVGSSADVTGATLDLRNQLEVSRRDLQGAATKAKDALNQKELAEAALRTEQAKVTACEGKLSDAPKDLLACRTTLGLVRGQAAQSQEAASRCDQGAKRCAASLDKVVNNTSILTSSFAACSTQREECVVKRAICEKDLERCHGVIP